MLPIPIPEQLKEAVALEGAVGLGIGGTFQSSSRNSNRRADSNTRLLAKTQLLLARSLWPTFVSVRPVGLTVCTNDLGL